MHHSCVLLCVTNKGNKYEWFTLINLQAARLCESDKPISGQTRLRKEAGKNSWGSDRCIPGEKDWQNGAKNQRLAKKTSRLIQWILQESIRVGYVLPAFLSPWGGLLTQETRPGQRPPLQEGTWDQAQRTPLEGTWDQAARQQVTSYRDPPPPVDRMTDTRIWKYYLVPHFVYRQ